MKFLKSYLRNLLIIVLVIAGMALFMRIFYPEALSVFPLMGQVYTGLNLWPFIILALLVFALPRRKH